MATSNDLKLAAALLDYGKQEICWPAVFQAVKNIVRANTITDETRSTLKNWLKSNDQLLPLLSLTVISTISLNCSSALRSQLCGPKWFTRLEKQLKTSQHPAVASAIAQLLADWAFLFGHEEIGGKSRALLAQSRYRTQPDGQPSQAAVDVAEEARMHLPPVGPARGVDFVKCYGKAGGLVRVPTGQTTTPTGSYPNRQNWRDDTPLGQPVVFTPGAVPTLLNQMSQDAAHLKQRLQVCKAAAGNKHMAQLTCAMDEAYKEAERCSEWRQKVQELSQTWDDAAAVCKLLTATDSINEALNQWQKFCSLEAYIAMGITIPPPPVATAAGLSQSAPGTGQRTLAGREPPTRSNTLPTPLAQPALQSANGKADAVGSSMVYASDLLGDEVASQPVTATQHNPFASVLSRPGSTSVLSNSDVGISGWTPSDVSLSTLSGSVNQQTVSMGGAPDNHSRVGLSPQSGGAVTGVVSAGPTGGSRVGMDSMGSGSSSSSNSRGASGVGPSRASSLLFSSQLASLNPFSASSGTTAIPSQTRGTPSNPFTATSQSATPAVAVAEASGKLVGNGVPQAATPVTSCSQPLNMAVHGLASTPGPGSPSSASSGSVQIIAPQAAPNSSILTTMQIHSGNALPAGVASGFPAATLATSSQSSVITSSSTSANNSAVSQARVVSASAQTSQSFSRGSFPETVSQPSAALPEYNWLPHFQNITNTLQTAVHAACANQPKGSSATAAVTDAVSQLRQLIEAMGSYYKASLQSQEALHQQVLKDTKARAVAKFRELMASQQQCASGASTSQTADRRRDTAQVTNTLQSSPASAQTLPADMSRSTPTALLGGTVPSALQTQSGQLPLLSRQPILATSPQGASSTPTVGASQHGMLQPPRLQQQTATSTQSLISNKTAQQPSPSSISPQPPVQSPSVPTIRLQAERASMQLVHVPQTTASSGSDCLQVAESQLAIAQHHGHATTNPAFPYSRVSQPPAPGPVPVPGPVQQSGIVSQPWEPFNRQGAMQTPDASKDCVIDLITL